LNRREVHQADLGAQEFEGADQVGGLGAVAQRQGDEADVDEVEADQQASALVARAVSAFSRP
jgi:hypothetical protein